jgi:pimeloyl-ACP methyl ester carboxylesterase
MPVRMLPFGCQQCRSRTLDINGRGLHFLEAGSPGAPPICFLHGGAAHAHWFDAVLGRFVPGHHVVSLDQRGHGRSAWAVPPAYATEDFVSDLAVLADRLGWERVTLVGHSMGGHNSMAFSAWHPERVRALVVVDSRPAIPPERLDRMRARGRRGPRRHPTRQAAVAAFRLLPPETVADPRLLEHLATEGTVERDGGWTYRFDPSANARRAPVDCWPLLARVKAPTLVVSGALSPVLPYPMAQRLRAAVPGARHVEIPGAYHHLVLDQPALFSAALTDFLAALG